MRIAFLGLPLAALCLLADGHELPVAFISRADAVGLRRLRRRLGDGRVHRRGELADRDVERALVGAAPDLLVSWFWTGKIPEAWVRTARLGGIGAHPSLLPRHRGPDPYFAAIDAGDVETGVTVHRIAQDYDTGPMLSRAHVSIDPTWNAWQLAKRLDRPSLSLLRGVVGRWARGEEVPETPQDEAEASWAETPRPEDCGILWADRTERILRRIRALAPAPGAFTEIGDLLVTVLRARAAPRFPRALAPGEAAVLGSTVVVRTADGAVELLEGELEDGSVVSASELAGLLSKSG